MKYAKMLALAAVAAGALMAFTGAGTASATVLCSTTADPCPAGQDWPVGKTFDFSSVKFVALTNTSGEELDKCSASTWLGVITNTGGSTTTVTGDVTKLTWESCTFPTTTLTSSKLEVHKNVGTSSGTVTSEGLFEVTINTVFFGSCIYGATSGGDFGLLAEGKPGAFILNSVWERIFGSNFACPETAKMTGEYFLTSPPDTTLSVSSS